MVKQSSLNQGLLQAIFNVSVDGIVVVARDGQIVMVNRAVQEIFQYSEEDLLTQQISMLLEPESYRSYEAYLNDEEALKVTETRGKGIEVIGVQRRRGDIPLRLFAHTLEIEEGRFVVLVLRNLSQQKYFEIESQRHQRELEDAVALAERRILQQQEDLLELSTPVLEVWPHVLVLPLIGTLDSRRTESALVRSLERIAELRAETVIVDITGVPIVDTMVADHLIQMAAAIRLMGVKCILTGIRPVIAKTIVQLGVNLQEIATQRTLAEGLAFAISEQRGEAAAWKR